VAEFARENFNGDGITTTGLEAIDDAPFVTEDDLLNPDDGHIVKDLNESYALVIVGDKAVIMDTSKESSSPLPPPSSVPIRRHIKFEDRHRNSKSEKKSPEPDKGALATFPLPKKKSGTVLAALSEP
jgi:hypothetical protein